jgi:hypothetical protein
MAKYTKYDKVRVSLGQFNSSAKIISGMEQFIDEVMTVCDVNPDGSYQMYEDDGRFKWYDDFLIEESRVDINHILRYFKEGTILYSPAYGFVELKNAMDTGEILVWEVDSEIDIRAHIFDRFGRLDATPAGECLLFPDAYQRDWTKLKNIHTGWRAEINQSYYYVNDIGDIVYVRDCDSYQDRQRYVIHNYFRTREFAEDSELYKLLNTEQ